MGSTNINFGREPPNMGGNNFPLTRQSSVYSLTFDEFQSAVGGGAGKDLGSMNMDELLKNIWSAEENYNMGSTAGAASTGHQEAGGGGLLLQKQGSFTLPRTLSQMTVEEVWRDMAKEFGGGGGGAALPGFGAPPQRQPTLGEVTLEEFLTRAGVVREDAAHAAAGAANNIGFFGDLQNPTLENMGLGFENMGFGNNTNRVPPPTMNNITQQKQQMPPHQQILPKQPILAFAGPTAAVPTAAQLASPSVRNLGISDQATNSAMVVQMPGLGPTGVGGGGGGVTTVPSPDVVMGNGVGDMPASVSPIPYLFNGGIRGRKSAALEKVIERRQRRMIKNRESAARSRARKQAYTMELEAEVAKLKEEKEELQKKQAEIREMQKNQELEMIKQKNGRWHKRQCLRRTFTGPW